MWVLGISLAHTGVRWRGVTIRTVGASNLSGALASLSKVNRKVGSALDGDGD